MTISELRGRTSKFFTGIVIRKAVLAFFTLSAIVCGGLGCFYYHLLLNDSMATLISVGAIAVPIILTLIAMALRGKDDYKRFMIITYASRMPVSEFKGAKELVSRVEELTKNTIGGNQGFKTCMRENKELLTSMLTDFKAFEQFANKGPVTLLAKLFISNVLDSFLYFALMDCVLSGGASNKQYRIMASTRWYKVYQSYSGSLMSWLIKKVIFAVAWIIVSAVITNILHSIFGLALVMQTIIYIGTLCLMWQLKKFKGREDQLLHIAADIVGDDNGSKVPQADYNLCIAFSQISSIYYNAAVEAGYIATTNQQSVQTGAQPQKQLQ